MKQIWPTYAYSPATNVLTLTGLNIDRDQLLLVTAADRGRIMYNFADSSVTASAFTSGANTALTLVATTAGLTTTAALVIYYDDQLASTTVTISSLPAISGTVTANVGGVSNILIGPPIAVAYSDEPFGDGRRLAVAIVDSNGSEYGCTGTALKVSGTVTLGAGTAQIGSVTASISGTVPISISSVTVGNSVTIASLPAISGTVTANNSVLSNVLSYDGNNYFLAVGGRTAGGKTDYPINISGAITVGNSVTIGSLPALVAGTAQIGSVTASISGTVPISISSVTVGNSVTIGSLPALAAGTAQIGSVTASISANPSGALTTRFGSVTTANTAQITTAVTNTSRKYLFAQNISIGSVTMGIGFSPTTTQGIQLSAGSGIVFDSFCPTGAVYWLGATTGAAWSILEG